jgi:hypothetical protein
MATPTSLPGAFTAGDVLTAANMNGLRGAFRILQVVSTTKTDTFSTSSTSYTDVTGLSVSITPLATSSKIYVTGYISTAYDNTATTAFFRLMRDSTAICVGDAAGSRDQGTANLNQGLSAVHSHPFVFLDSPNTTSATTYKAQVRVNVGQAVTMYVNRSVTDTDAGNGSRVASTITVMEVSA